MCIVCHEHVLTVRQDSTSNKPHIVHTPPPVSQHVLFTMTATWLRHYCDTKQKNLLYFRECSEIRLMTQRGAGWLHVFTIMSIGRDCVSEMTVVPSGDVWLRRAAVELY
jgi:hypothetical protein